MKLQHICIICKEKGTAKHKIQFITCDNHTQLDFFKREIETKQKESD